MELCLYDHEHGYYSSHVRTIGTGGDFATTPTLAGILAKAIARTIRFTGLQDIIEIGPGAGHLATALRREFKPPFPQFRKLPRYHLVERAPRLRSVLRRQLGRSVRFHTTMKSALRATGGAAFIFSNELVDAFPVRVFRKGDNHWQELVLEGSETGIEEQWLPADRLPDSSLFRQPWTPGQCLEVHASYRQWMEDWLPHWKTGHLLTIDYGGAPEEIYHRKPAGTIRGYYHHECVRGANLYRLPGRQDLTADVNFDDLVRWGKDLGLHDHRLVTQREYCSSFLGKSSQPAERFLIDVHGAGQAFKVLLQERG